MKKLFFLLALFVFLIPIISLNAQNSQKGVISGKIIDGGTGEIMRRATILVKDTKLGAYADVLGTFKIKNVPVGTYSLRVSFVGYITKEIQNVQVTSDKITDIGTITLESEKKTTDEVEVVAERINDNASALLAVRKNAAQVSDGISAEEIKRTPDGDAGQSLRRVSGVTLVSNKYVFVRGVSERYSNTTLNGTELSSTDPDKKAFSFDMFPAEFLQNANVAKTFTPDLPGNFAGGLVELNTVDYPSGFALKFGAGVSMSDNITFKGNMFISNPGSSTDWLGYDDGLRSLPEAVPSSPQAFRDFLAYDMKSGDVNTRLAAQNRYLAIINEFHYEQFKKQSSTAPMNGNLSLSYSDIFNVGGNDLGVIASFIYGNEYSSNDIVRKLLAADKSYKFDGSGSTFTNSTNMGFIANFAYKIGESTSLSFKNTFNNQSENELGYLTGYKESSQIYQTSTKFEQKSLYSSQLGAEHQLPILNSIFNWKLGYSHSFVDEPDLRRMRFSRRDTADPYLSEAIAATDGGGSQSGRFFSTLNEDTYNAKFDFKIPIETSSIKFGGLYQTKNRDYIVRSLVMYLARNDIKNYVDDSTMTFVTNKLDPNLYQTMTYTQDPLAIDPSQTYNLANFGFHGLGYVEETSPVDSYKASEDIGSAYLMGDFIVPLGDNNLRIIAGARVENSRQNLQAYFPFTKVSNNGDTLTFDSTLVNETYFDVLPSINFVYQASKDMNIRLSASQTLSRPSFRELSPTSFYNFNYQTVEKGNPEIQRALIQNYDLRWEWFPNPGEVMSVSLFYKNFHNAIEQTIIPTASEPIITYQNADGDAKNYGVEFEIRKNMSFFANDLKDFNFNFNLSLINSVLTVQQAQKSETRTMWGQSPYTINLGIFWSKSDWGTSANIAYNRIGKRIIRVAAKTTYPALDDPHIYEMPRNVIDFSISQEVMKNFSVKFVIKDLLNEQLIWQQGGENVDIDLGGSKFSFSAGYNF